MCTSTFLVGLPSFGFITADVQIRYLSTDAPSRVIAMPYDLMATQRVQSLQYHCVRSDHSCGDGRPLGMR